MYVDTGGCFSATRIKEFHRGFVTDDADSAEVEQHLNLTLDLITVLRVHDVMELFKVLEELGLGLAGDSGVPGDGGLEGERAGGRPASRWVCSSSTVSPPCSLPC